MATLRLAPRVPIALTVGRNNRTIFKKAIAQLERVQDALPDAVELAMLPIYREAMRLVPVDTGALKASVYLEQEKTRGGKVQVVLGFARWGYPKYAIYVHEDPRPYHCLLYTSPSPRD